MVKKAHPSAFTLVELLVVIGIIGVLIGILLPTLAAARESGRSVKCLASLRQLAIGFQMFQSEHKGVIETTDMTLLDQFNKGGYTSIPMSEGINCPTFRDLGDQGGPVQRGFGVNGWLASLVGQGRADGTPFKLGRVRDGSKTVLYADTAQIAAGQIAFGIAANYNNPYGMLANNIRADGKSLDIPTFHARHRNRGSVLWLDGHATLEAPVYAPSGRTIEGISSDKLKLFKLGYLIPPGTQLETMSAQAYSFTDPSCLQTTDNVKDLLRLVRTPTVTYWTPKVEYWR